MLLANPAAPKPLSGVLVLPASETDRDGILAAMRKYLVDEPKRGDTVVFYDASHGSLRVNSKGTKLTVLTGGKYDHAIFSPQVCCRCFVLWALYRFDAAVCRGRANRCAGRGG